MRNLFFVAVLVLPMMTIAMGNTETVEFKVNGNCGGCKATIENAAKIEGVSKAEWSVETKMLSLTYCNETVDLNDVYQKIADAGYSTEKHEATGATNCSSSEEKSNCESETGKSDCGSKTKKSDCGPDNDKKKSAGKANIDVSY